MQLSRSGSQRVAIGAAFVLGVAALGGCAPLRAHADADARPPRTSPRTRLRPRRRLAPLTGVEVPAGSRHQLVARREDRQPPGRATADRPRTAPTSCSRSSSRAASPGTSRSGTSDIPTEIGPVRSIRPMDPDIVSPFGGIIAYSGGQQQFVALMRRAPTSTTRSTVRATPRRSCTDEGQGRTAQRDRQGARAARDASRDPRRRQQQYSYAPDVAGSSAARDGADGRDDRPRVQPESRFAAGL